MSSHWPLLSFSIAVLLGRLIICQVGSKYSSHKVACFLTLLAVQKLLSVIHSHLRSFTSVVCALGVLFKYSRSHPQHQCLGALCLCFLPAIPQSQAFNLQSILRFHFILFSIYGEQYRSGFILLHIHIVLPAPLIKEIIIIQRYGLNMLSKKISWLSICGLISWFSIWLH